MIGLPPPGDRGRAACLAPDGRAAFVDDGPGEAAFEVDLDADVGLPTASRHLPDGGWSRGWTPVSRAGHGSELGQSGSEHRVVKVLHDLEELRRETFFAGWAHPR